MSHDDEGYRGQIILNLNSAVGWCRRHMNAVPTRLCTDHKRDLTPSHLSTRKPLGVSTKDYFPSGESA
jgi:hypothetical protein